MSKPHHLLLHILIAFVPLYGQNFNYYSNELIGVNLKTLKVYDYEELFGESVEKLSYVLVTKFDRNGNITHETYYDSTGKMSNRTSKFAKVRYAYDSHGKMSEETYYNAEGMLSQDYMGVCKYVYKKGSQGNLLSTGRYDATGQLVDDIMKVCKNIFRYDDTGNQLEEILYNSDGEYVDDWLPYRTQKLYDTAGNIIEEVSYTIYEGSETVDGKEYKYKYNKKGVKESVSIYDSDHKMYPIIVWSQTNSVHLI